MNTATQPIPLRFTPIGASRGGLMCKIRRSAFTLVEVVLALGILSLSFLTLFNLIPVGLDTMTASIDATTGMQIVQRVTTIARQAKFSELSKLDRYPGMDADKAEKGDFFFDYQGNELPTAVGYTSPNVVYSAAVYLLPMTYVPAANGAQTENKNIRTLNIMIRKSGGKKLLKTVNVMIANNGL